MSTINFPSAHELDTTDHREGSGYRVALYLVPAAETSDGTPRVEVHGGVGNIGTPERAYHGRWHRIGGYGAGVVGESVLDQLRAATDTLTLISDSYLGAEWDGSNHRGRWDDGDFAGEALELESALRHAWDAFAWFGAANVGWLELCAEASVDPERALGDDWEAVAAEVADIIEPLQDEIVRGTVDYCEMVADKYREDHDASR